MTSKIFLTIFLLITSLICSFNVYATEIISKDLISNNTHGNLK
ncbi:MAG: hypothetical protein QXF15_03355 [Candidatus Aenigmatarchaeota archaeon]